MAQSHSPRGHDKGQDGGSDTSSSSSTTTSSGGPSNAAQQQAMLPSGFDPAAEADKLHEAMGGWGTDERAVLDGLYTGRRDMVQAIRASYDARYSPGLATALRNELSGETLTKALRLLSNGDLTLSDKIKEGASGWGTDEAKIFDALERATPDELAAARADAQVMRILNAELSGEDLALANAYLAGQGALAAQLRRAVSGWGTDEETIFRALESASPEEKAFVLAQPKLLSHLSSDLGERDYQKARRMLRGELTNVDRLEIAMAGWGTDEAGVAAALAGITGSEFPNLPSDIDARLDAELSGRALVLAQEALHQKRLEFDVAYRENTMKALGEQAVLHDGASALIAQEGQAHSAVAQLKAACAGLGTDDQGVWTILAGLSPSEREFIRTFNPSGVLDDLRRDLSKTDYAKVMGLLGDGGSTLALRKAVEGWGTDEALIYTAVEQVLRDGKGPEVLADAELMQLLRADLSQDRFMVLSISLANNHMSPEARLAWATLGNGTNEDLLFAVCAEYGAGWTSGGSVDAEVDALLRRELSTQDYWQALDLIRGEPTTEQERLDRSKERLERERGGLSTAIMDRFTSSGQNADDAWREYQGSFNRAQADGQVSTDEEQGLRRDEAFSDRKTQEYAAAKGTVATWATSIAVAIVGICATILTAGAAGPFVAGLAASLGGQAAVAAEAMVLAAAMKVGLNKAILGEGYDLTSGQALVDAVGASVEVGMGMLGGALTGRIVEGMSKTGVAQVLGPNIERIFGAAGKRILGAGLHGAVDGALGGFVEGGLNASLQEETWGGDWESAFNKIGVTAVMQSGVSSAGGFIAGAGVQSIAETFGPMLRGRAPETDPRVHNEPEGPEIDGPEVTEPRLQDTDLPKLGEKHEGVNGYTMAEKAQPFVQGEGDAMDISPYDVKQGALGDCYLMAGMAATARANPESIRRIVKDNGDGTFDVTLFLKDNYWSDPKPWTTTVDARLPMQNGSPLYAAYGSRTADADELWPALLEKALAQRTGSYEFIRGSKVGSQGKVSFSGASELFTGKPVNRITPSSMADDALLTAIQDGLTSNKPVQAGVKTFEEGASELAEAKAKNVIGNHAYAIESVDLVAKTINLQNPWGMRHVVALPVKDFKRWYTGVQIGQ